MNEHGLSTEEAKARLKRYGLNTITAHSNNSPLILFLSQFKGFINGILALAALASFVIGDTLESIFIFAIIVLNAVFTFLQEYRAEKSLEKLKSYAIQQVRVRRNGKEIQLPSTEIVPGDIIHITEGDRIAADGRLLSSNHLEIDEAILTGESLPVIKEAQDEIFTGTLVVKGNGVFTVEKTGMETKFGKIAQSLANIPPEKTPLQKQLAMLGKMLSLLAVVLSMLIIPIGLMQGREPIDLLFLAVSVAIASIPEGLTAIITIALAVGTNRMAHRDAIVRKMPSVETLGSVQVILTDKTGTLTQNKMRVKEHWKPRAEHMDHLLTACLLGNTATLVKRATTDDVEIVGDQTDGALLIFALEANPKIKDVIATGKSLDEHTFDSRLKTVSTTWQHDKKRYVFVRGAPEVILDKSTATKQEREIIEKKISEYAKNGLRVIAFGSKVETRTGKLSREKLEEGITFLGIVGIYDPPRDEVKLALKKADKAGIRTIMVTGDNELTAISIAKEIGLVDTNEDVITGDELDKLTDAELKETLTTTRIFARAKPEDKLRLVSLLKKQGYVVGVTGDGVNDALALKQADVGVAMGKSGTDVAKEASDIVLADDNFATLISAVEEGRTIYHNIVKAILYLLTGNLSEITLVLFSLLFGITSPLLPTQILWINLVTDGLPALGLAVDTKDPKILRAKPRNPKEPILTKRRIGLITLLGLNIAAFLTLLYIVLLANFSNAFSRTIIFNALILCHIPLAFVIRGQSIFRINPFLLATVVVTVILQTVITTIPFFQEIFELTWNPY